MEDFPLLNDYEFYFNRSEIEKDPTSIIPKKIMLEIFSHLEVSDLGRCSSVNKRWKQLASDDHLWKRLYTKDYVELDTEFAHYKYEYWKRQIEFNSKEDYREYLKDSLTEKQKEKISCWHYSLHNVAIDVIGYFLVFLFTVLVSLKKDSLVDMNWICVFLPLFLSFLIVFVRILSVVPNRMAMMKHGFSSYNPRLTRQAGFIYCFAHHHRAKSLARLHLLFLVVVLFMFFLFCYLKISGHIRYWSSTCLPLIFFLIGLIQTSLCGFGRPHFKKSTRLLFLLFLIPIELLIILTSLRLDRIIKWNWWVVTSPSWFLYVILSFLFLLTWMKVLKDSIFSKRQGCCSVLYSGLVMLLIAFAIFGPIILYQLMSIIRAEYNWKIHNWVISIPLFVQEIFILPLAYIFWKKYY